MYNTPVSKKPGVSWAIASLVCGIGTILTFWFFPIGFVLGVCAIVFFAIQNKKGQSGMATAGLIIGIIGLAFTVTIGGCIGLIGLGMYGIHSETMAAVEAVEKSRTDSSAIRVSSSALASAYNENEIAADERYKGRVVLITGNISSIGTQTISDNPNVVLAGHSPFAMVHCQFNENQKSSVARLRTGQQVTIRGVVEGKFFNSVFLNRCIVE